MNCGICLAACPADVFSQVSLPEQKLVETAAGLPDALLTVVCALHSQPDRPAAPPSTVLRHRRCLAALALGDLLTLAGSGARRVRLDDLPCATCPLQAAASLQEQVNAANELLVAYGQPAALELATAAPTAPLGRALHVVDGAQLQVSRRRLFSALRQSLAKPKDAPLPARRRLLAALPSVEETIAVVLPPSAPFAQVTVDPARCSGCSLCTRFCPTGALQWSTTTAESDSDQPDFELAFIARRCINCPICTIACPEGAIRLTDGVTAAALEETPAPLVAGRLAPCSVCGMPTAAISDSPHCHVCRHGAGPVTALHDGAGLMADLLQRSALLSDQAGRRIDARIVPPV